MSKPIDIVPYTEDVYGTNTLGATTAATAAAVSKVGDAIIDYGRSKKRNAFNNKLEEVEAEAEAEIAKQTTTGKAGESAARVSSSRATTTIFGQTEAMKAYAKGQKLDSLASSGQATGGALVRLQIEASKHYYDAMARTDDLQLRNEITNRMTTFSAHNPAMLLLGAIKDVNKSEAQRKGAELESIRVRGQNVLNVPTSLTFNTPEYWFEYTRRENIYRKAADNAMRLTIAGQKKAFTAIEFRETVNLLKEGDSGPYKAKYEKLRKKHPEMVAIYQKMIHNQASSTEIEAYEEYTNVTIPQTQADLIRITADYTALKQKALTSGLADNADTKTSLEQLDALITEASIYHDALQNFDLEGGAPEILQATKAAMDTSWMRTNPIMNAYILAINNIKTLTDLAMMPNFSHLNKVLQDGISRATGPVVQSYFEQLDFPTLLARGRAISGYNFIGTEQGLRDGSTEAQITTAATSYTDYQAQRVMENFNTLFPEIDMQDENKRNNAYKTQATYYIGLMHANYNVEGDLVTAGLEHTLAPALDTAMTLFNVSSNTPQFKSGDAIELENKLLGDRNNKNKRSAFINVISSFNSKAVTPADKVVGRSASLILGKYLMTETTGLKLRRNEMERDLQATIEIDGKTVPLSDFILPNYDTLASEGYIRFELSSEIDKARSFSHSSGTTYHYGMGAIQARAVAIEIQSRLNRTLGLLAAEQMLRSGNTEPDFLTAAQSLTALFPTGE